MLRNAEKKSLYVGLNNGWFSGQFPTIEPCVDAVLFRSRGVGPRVCSGPLPVAVAGPVGGGPAAEAPFGVEWLQWAERRCRHLAAAGSSNAATGSLTAAGAVSYPRDTTGWVGRREEGWRGVDNRWRWVGRGLENVIWKSKENGLMLKIIETLDIKLQSRFYYWKKGICPFLFSWL